MKPTAPLTLALLLAAIAAAPLNSQTPAFTDPANLRGERVAPLTGRELPIDQGALGLQQLLRKLNTRASIMNIVAHPDDEDGGMMALYSRGLGARVADISLTRGEGGQNAVTSDFEDALGLLRTQELLSSDRYPGVDQFFGTEVDFGFSKTKEEAFAKWTHERVLYDVVRAIRLYRPLVLTSTWIGGVTDGHGQHQVSGEIAQEAFVAAGDPKVFPELTAEGILPWQPLRIYARVPMRSISDKGLFDYATGQYTPAKFTNYVTGEVSTTPPSADVIVHEGAPDPLLTTCAANPADLPANLSSRPESAHFADGVERPAALATPSVCEPFTYVQFARIGLGLQRSQVDPGVRNAPAGAFDVAYHLYGSRLPPSASPPTNLSSRPERSAVERSAGSTDDPTFFTGIETSIEGIAALAPNAPDFLPESLKIIQAQISQAAATFHPADPSGTAPILGDCLQKLTVLISRIDSSALSAGEKEDVVHELRMKHVQLNQALILALGLTFDATTSSADVTSGSAVSVWAALHSKFSSPLTVNKVWLTTSQGEVPGKTTTKTETPELTANRPSISTLTATSGFTSDITRPYFFRNSIEVPVYQLKVPTLRDAPQTPPALIAHAELDYRGTIINLSHVVHADTQPVSIVPALNVALTVHAQVLAATNHALSITAEAASPDGVRDRNKGAIRLEAPVGWKVEPPTSSIQTGHAGFSVTPPETLKSAAVLTASAHLTLGGQTYTEGYRPIGYGNLPLTNYYTPATDRIVPVDLKLPAHHNIAYLPGTGDAIPEALASIGLAPTILTVSDLTPGHLKQFDTVILGVRTYNAHPDLHGAPTQALIDYARNGGNVLVQYQTPEFTADDAPYPLSLGPNEKVVDETAPVHLLTTNAPQLTTPNTIVFSDFDGWVEERGHGFLSTWDPRYTALTETHDPGQLPQKGGLITTQLGKGHWTYCAFALYRQLPEAIPGAYRIFLNLLTP
jgi:LmbE family N-acetylglucosaminyl deacetylase